MLLSMDTLLRAVKVHYKKEGRAHLPWRQTRDPYKILVSEIMLQQTQVERVIPFYNRFIKKFPTAKTLARAPLADVLLAWQGLGYNRRAKYLWEASKILSKAEAPRGGVRSLFISPERGASAPHLPGVGHYTARAVAAFAFNNPEPFVETNIRTVFIHFFFPKKKVSDAQILPLVAKALTKSKMQPRDFYAALMDYGAYLKKSGVRVNNRSAHYAKQSKFEGSRRQKQAAKLRALLAVGASERELQKLLGTK